MFGYEDISLHFLTGSATIVALTLLLLILTAVYLYRRTNPPLPLYMKIILGGLRVIAVIALVFTLAEPVISYNRLYERSRRITVLADASASMNREESGKLRRERLDSLIDSRDYERLSGNAELSLHFFGGNLADSPDDVIRDRTAIGDVLDQLQARQISRPADCWLLLSDGRSNSGQDARKIAAKLAQPVITVDMSADTGTFDIGIDDIDYNPILFVGQRTEFRAKLSWSNAADMNVPVQLVDSNRVVGETNHSVRQLEGFAEITLPYLPESPGQKILTLRVPAMSGEEVRGNNSRSFSVKVLKSRLLILLATEAPDYEIGFLKRLLERSDKYQVDLVVTGSKSGNLAGRFPSRQTELNRYDLLILYDPDPRHFEPSRDLLNSYLSEKGGAVWVMMGENYSRRGPVTWFNEIMPFFQTRRDPVDYLTFHGEPSESQLYHPAVRLDNNPAAIRKYWAELPPFRSLVSCDSIHPDAVILAFSSLSEARPILGYRRFGAGKLMASAALPFWPWGFVNLGFGEDEQGYAKFVEGAAGWLTLTDDLQPVRAGPEKDVFHRGEAIRFDGFAFDLGFRPIPGVTGTVSLSGSEDDRNYDTDFIAGGEGTFRAWFYNVAPGGYQFRARLEQDGRLLKEETGSIMVESFSLEEINQSGDPAALSAVASLSAGGYFKFDEFDDAVNSVDLSRLSVAQKGEISVLNKPLLLILFIAAMCTEWLIRKLNQLL